MLSSVVFPYQNPFFQYYYGWKRSKYTIEIVYNFGFKFFRVTHNNNMNTVILCLEVFFARMLDVSIGSVRTILLVKGKNLISTILAFIEILIWYYVARETLTSNNTPLPVILSYASGYAIGTYVGGLINKYFVKGNLTAFVITSLDNKDMVDKLKKAQYGVSVISVEDGKLILLIEFKKKNLKKLRSTITRIDKSAFIIVNESMHVENGYIN